MIPSRDALLRMRYARSGMSVLENMNRFYIPEPNSGCWIWTGFVDSEGYGNIHLKSYNVVRAHRVSYVIHKSDIPDGMVVMHSCDNPSCINPDHLSVGTMKDNVADCYRKGRNRSNKGSKNSSSKLKEEDISEIRSTYLKGDVHRGLKAMSDRFGVSVSAICNIVNWKSWK